jgi:hypothetical protein
MCDYSLQGLPNRLAVGGEELVTHRFPTGSMGMASPVDIACRTCPEPETTASRSWWSTVKRWLILPDELPGLPAVCIPPGTRLLMNRIPDALRKEFALDALESVTFVQLSDQPFQYRDALRFANGRQILLQSVREGVMFVVLATCPDESARPSTRTAEPEAAGSGVARRRSQASVINSAGNYRPSEII